MNTQYIKTELARCHGTIDKLSEQTKKMQKRTNDAIKSHTSSSQLLNSITRCLENKLFGKIYKRSSTTNRATIVVPYNDGVALISKEKQIEELKLCVQLGIRDTLTNIITFNSISVISNTVVHENDTISAVYVDNMFWVVCNDVVYSSANGEIWTEAGRFSNVTLVCVRAHDHEVDVIGSDNAQRLYHFNYNKDDNIWNGGRVESIQATGVFTSFDYDRHYNMLVCGYKIDYTNITVNALLFHYERDNGVWIELHMIYKDYYWNSVTYNRATDNWIVTYGQITNGSTNLVDKMLSVSVDSNTLAIRPNMSTKYAYALNIGTCYVSKIARMISVVKTKETAGMMSRTLELVGSLWTDSTRKLELTDHHEPMFTVVDDEHDCMIVSTIKTNETGYELVLFALGYPITEHIKRLTTIAIKNQL